MKTDANSHSPPTNMRKVVAGERYRYNRGRSQDINVRGEAGGGRLDFKLARRVSQG